MGSQKHIPRKLYRYCRVDSNTEDVFREHKLYAPGPDKFNDPFDCRTGLSTECTKDDFEKAFDANHLGLQKHLAPNDNRKAQIESLYLRKDELFKPGAESKLQKFIYRTGVLCFSELPNHILMWSHYADKHQGICLEFDTDIGKALFSCRDKFVARKIEYCNDLPVFECFNLNLAEMAERAVFRKALDWKYEKEWRILTKRSNQKVVLPQGTLTGVILGAKICADQAVIVRKWCENVDPHPKIYETRLQKDAYGLEIPELPST